MVAFNVHHQHVHVEQTFTTKGAFQAFHIDGALLHAVLASQMAPQVVLAADAHAANLAGELGTIGDVNLLVTS